MGIDQRPATPQPLPDIRYRGDLSVFEPALGELRGRFAGNPQVEFTHLLSYHGDLPAVEVVTPFVFDRRQFPSKYRGLWLLHHFSGAGYSFGADPTALSPQWMEDFVDFEADQVRQQLGTPEMEREEMLDALSAGLGGLRSIVGGFEGYREAYEALSR